MTIEMSRDRFEVCGTAELHSPVPPAGRSRRSGCAAPLISSSHFYCCGLVQVRLQTLRRAARRAPGRDRAHDDAPRHVTGSGARRT